MLRDSPAEGALTGGGVGAPPPPPLDGVEVGGGTGAELPHPIFL